jgi:hypothetical protein
VEYCDEFYALCSLIFVLIYPSTDCDETDSGDSSGCSLYSNTPDISTTIQARRSPPPSPFTSAHATVFHKSPAPGLEPIIYLRELSYPDLYEIHRGTTLAQWDNVVTNPVAKEETEQLEQKRSRKRRLTEDNMAYQGVDLTSEAGQVSTSISWQCVLDHTC